jgi:hypothetical protein
MAYSHMRYHKGKVGGNPYDEPLPAAELESIRGMRCASAVERKTNLQPAIGVDERERRE